MFASAAFSYDGDIPSEYTRQAGEIGDGYDHFHYQHNILPFDKLRAGVGAHYEVMDGVVTKYYYAGSQRIAMRTDGALSFILGDHLGSTSLVTDANGQNPIETRYTAWGEVRYASGTMPTKYTYTGQYSYTADFGLMFFNARWVDVSLGRFAQADSIMPGGIQGLDRYAYANNSPVRYTDPSGHRACDDEFGCNGKSIKPDPRKGCSVMSGGFNGSFNCTATDLNQATIKQRQTWFNEMLASVDPKLPESFTNINGILNAFIDTDTGVTGSWASWGDAGILTSIQNGLAWQQNKPYTPGSIKADRAWYNYFNAYFINPKANSTYQLWGAGEAAGTEYGMLLASAHNQQPDHGETMFLMIGNSYRSGLLNRRDPQFASIPTDPSEPTSMVVGEHLGIKLYAWFYDPSSTVPGVNVPPVQMVAEVLLRIP